MSHATYCKIFNADTFQEEIFCALLKCIYGSVLLNNFGGRGDTREEKEDRNGI